MSDWSADDPALSKGLAPYEPSALMRWHRARVPSKDIMRMLKLRGTQLAKRIEAEAEKERQAEQTGRPIHRAVMPEDSQ